MLLKLRFILNQIFIFKNSGRKSYQRATSKIGETAIESQAEQSASRCGGNG